MKTRPILFSGPMVRALLDGRKTQTRRVVKNAESMPTDPENYEHNGWAFCREYNGGDFSWPFPCPYGEPGDLLWVRETWACYRQTNYEYDEWEQVFSAAEREEWGGALSPVYQADNKSFPDRWNPSIHMPRWVSRLTLEITGVRVERLQDISEPDAIAEGIEPVEGRFWKRYKDGGWNTYVDCPIGSYASLWTEINGSGSWNANPWVWVLEFRVHKQNVDALLKARAA